MGLTSNALNRHGQIAYRAELANGNELVRLWTPDLHWRNENLGVWENSSNWTLGLTPDYVHRTFIDPDFNAVVLGPTDYTHVQQLVVGNGLADTILVLQQGTTIEVDNGLAVVPNATLIGSGNIAGDASIRGTLAPSIGSDGFGAISISGDLELNGATVEIELGGLNFGEFDFLGIGDDLTIDDTDLNVVVDPLFMLDEDMQFLIARINDERQVEFNGLSELGLVGNFAGTNLFITYFGGDGNDIVLFTGRAIPEPGTTAFLCVAAMTLFCRRRRRDERHNAQAAMLATTTAL